MKSVKLSSCAVGLMCLLVAGTAAAQQAQAEGEVGMALPGQAGPQAGVAAGESDHDSMIGRLAVGYLGRRSLFIGCSGNLAPCGAGGRRALDAPVVGIRYWVDQMIGIDAGVGVLLTSGTTEQSTPPPAGGSSTVDDPGIGAFLLHAGVPISLGSEGHFSFQLVPEVNVGFASASESPGVPPGAPAGTPPDPDVDWTGFHLDAGLRVGAEIHFGFIDIPQLSLQGSIGARFALDSTSITSVTPGIAGESTFDRSTTEFATTVGDNPWNIFVSNVAALYYF